MMRRIAHADLTVSPVPILLLAGDRKVEAALAAHASHAIALSQARKDIMDLVQRAVASLVHSELVHTPSHVRSIVETLLQDVRNARAITVQVHPEDRGLLPDAAELAQSVEALGVISIVEDLTLGRGDCMVTSALGDIDARIETKLEQFRQLLLKQLGE